MTRMADVAEKEPEWLIQGYIPKHQITIMAGDGGSGKTTLWCAIAAAVSSGNVSFLEKHLLPEGFGRSTPKKVMFFSSEDSFEYTLKRRLAVNGANEVNIFTIGIDDERFPSIKFNDSYLEELIAEHRPELVIFDPLQSFIPPEIQMGQRNAMRSCLNPLVGLGEKYKVTFLVIVHANKQSGVYGRKRIADSADIWDISRSVLMAGMTGEKGVRYLSHEKSNYAVQEETILFAIKDGLIEVKGLTDKRDREYVNESFVETRLAPAKDEAKEFILEFLADGEKEVAELDGASKAMGISIGTLKRAKAELKKEEKIRYRNAGSGRSEDKKYYIALIPSAEMIQ